MFFDLYTTVGIFLSCITCCPAAKMFKNRLLEYAQKNSLPRPVFDTVNEGPDHLPRFKCSVTVNGTKYDSPTGSNYKKPAENAAAEAAVKDLLKQGLLMRLEETVLLKNVLDEFAVKKNMRPPAYSFSKEGGGHCPTFTATVQVNGVSYTGGPANSKKDAASKAAFEAIRAIDPHYCNSFTLVEVRDENTKNTGSQHPTGECDVSKSDSKMPTDNLTSNNQLVGGCDSHSPENGIENATSENAPAVEKGSKKSDVENPSRVEAFEAEKSITNINPSTSTPATQPHNQLQQDPLLAQQGQSKEEIGDVHLDEPHGFQEIEGKQEGSQEVDLTASISNRSINESENAEQMSKRKKKHKGKNKAKRMKKQATA